MEMDGFEAGLNAKCKTPLSQAWRPESSVPSPLLPRDPFIYLVALNLMRKGLTS